MWSVWGGRGNNCDKNNWRNLSVTFGVDSMPNWISIRPKNSTKGECNTARDRERERDAIMETTDFQALKVIDLKCSWYLCEILWQFMATSSNYSWSMINWSRNCRDWGTKVALLYVSLSASLFVSLPFSRIWAATKFIFISHSEWNKNAANTLCAPCRMFWPLTKL